MPKLNKEEVILLFLESPKLLEKVLIKGQVMSSDEIRSVICEFGDSYLAYCYAVFVDKMPKDDTRTIACLDSWDAFLYAVNVDKKPTDETRESVTEDPYWKEAYEKWENSLKKT